MNIQRMMRQVQNAKKKMEENQEKFDKLDFVGSASNGLVTVTLKGTGVMTSIKIDKSIVDANDIETLEDLIMVSYNDAREKLSNASDQTASDAMGGIDLKNFHF